MSLSHLSSGRHLTLAATSQPGWHVISRAIQSLGQDLPPSFLRGVWLWRHESRAPQLPGGALKRAVWKGADGLDTGQKPTLP